MRVRVSCKTPPDKTRPRRTEVWSKSGAGNETRTRDPDLGKVVLYQLSYSRSGAAHYAEFKATVKPLCAALDTVFARFARLRKPL